MLLYIHGFNSSAQSGKARELAAWMGARGLAEAQVCPDLPSRPARAMTLLEDLVMASRGPAKLIGSSLGGFYATWLAEKHDLKAVLVNPCVACHDKLAAYVGQTQKNWHSGEEYVFTQTHLSELRALAVRPRRLRNYLLLLETGDTVLDYREAVDFYAGARQVVLAGGDHGFTRFTEYLPAILEF
ncbi:MAG TPA: YqiA/YcfP family alpha/beta fold hydrolase [Thiobacillaceae bacterium]|nr:YqiA/YcfP family alpha/beta fold hydrolase [Thiobacillaceae bacterium]HNU63846.1 YqiA/YcfP family alpha/beta fold hydrolase [Thiobacillaceae bacterium]